jgi:DNA-binding IclR family transcriptional regulator
MAVQWGRQQTKSRVIPQCGTRGCSLKSLRKISLILESFNPEAPRLGLQTIAERTGLPKSTVHRLLAGLKDVGLVVQDGNRDIYRLGLRLLPLSGVVLRDLDVPRHARKPAAMLMNQSGEAVHVCVFDGQNVVSIDRHEMADHTNEIVRLEREPPYCTGTGKAVLAALSDETIKALLGEKLESYTENTITDKSKLMLELKAARSRGYAIDNEERQLGIRCVGAAIRYRKEVVGAISVTGPKERIPQARIPILAELVMATAARISLSIEDQ